MRGEIAGGEDRIDKGTVGDGESVEISNDGVDRVNESVAIDRDIGSGEHDELVGDEGIEIGCGEKAQVVNDAGGEVLHVGARGNEASDADINTLDREIVQAGENVRGITAVGGREVDGQTDEHGLVVDAHAQKTGQGHGQVVGRDSEITGVLLDGSLQNLC